MAKCKRCVHLPICKWCADNTSVFHFPAKNAECEMCNTDFDDMEEAVHNAQFEAKKLMDQSHDDALKFSFAKGRWSAFKDVAALMAERGADNATT